MTSEEKLALLTKDFLERDGDHFVRIRKEGRLGWEDTLPEDSAYSAVILNPESDRDLVRNAYRLASQMIVAMDAPYKVSVRIDATRSCTDSHSVFVASKVLDDEALPVGRRLDVFLGLAIHEGCHLKWTDFTQMASEDNGIVRNLINLLEDERIERLCGEVMPGYANYLKATKYYMFDLYRQRKAQECGEEELPAPARLLNAILAIIRYPKALDRDDLDEFVDYLYEVREIVKDFPSTPAEVTAAAKAV